MTTTAPRTPVVILRACSSARLDSTRLRRLARRTRRFVTNEEAEQQRSFFLFCGLSSRLSRPSAAQVVNRLFFRGGTPG
ncbi:hypothetical protein MTO96_013550 [Rhipicephalus appendiculatus]